MQLTLRSLTVLSPDQVAITLAHPSVNAEGRRIPALRFGDPRVMALAGALRPPLLAVTGITNKSLHALMTGLLHAPGQMTYDLRRLRLHGLIRRLGHTNRYVLTPDGIKAAVFYTKLHNRLRPCSRRRPAPSLTRTPHRPAHHRPARQWLYHPGTAHSRRVKT